MVAAFVVFLSCQVAVALRDGVDLNMSSERDSRALERCPGYCCANGPPAQEYKCYKKKKCADTKGHKRPVDLVCCQGPDKNKIDPGSSVCGTGPDELDEWEDDVLRLRYELAGAEARGDGPGTLHDWKKEVQRLSDELAGVEARVEVSFLRVDAGAEGERGLHEVVSGDRAAGAVAAEVSDGVGMNARQQLLDERGVSGKGMVALHAAAMKAHVLSTLQDAIQKDNDRIAALHAEFLANWDQAQANSQANWELATSCSTGYSDGSPCQKSEGFCKPPFTSHHCLSTSLKKDPNSLVFNCGGCGMCKLWRCCSTLKFQPLRCRHALAYGFMGSE